MQRVLLIANYHAGAMSEGAREAIGRELSAEFELEIAETEQPRHATELARAAAEQGQAVLALGGDGTVNEVAQELIGGDVPLGILPAGTTNVIARGLGIPNDPVEATAFVVERLKSRKTRRIGVGQIDGHYFVANAGMGLDGEVVKRTEGNPRARGRLKDWVFLQNVMLTALTRYARAEPAITMEVEGANAVRTLLVICCNLHPYTYFKRWAVDVCPFTRPSGGLDFLGVTALPFSAIPRITYSVLRSRSHIRWPLASYHVDAAHATLTADRPMPVQIDGEFVGDLDEAIIRRVPDALEVFV